MVWFRFMMFNATFNNISVISWRSVLLVEETGVPGENHRPQTNFITLYHIMLYCWKRSEDHDQTLTTLNQDRNNLRLVVKSLLHSTHLYSSGLGGCLNFTCFSYLFLDVNTRGHNSHLTCIFPPFSCTLMWDFKLILVLNPLPHKLHLKERKKYLQCNLSKPNPE